MEGVRSMNISSLRDEEPAPEHSVKKTRSYELAH
jgi:hypothetical protein